MKAALAFVVFLATVASALAADGGQTIAFLCTVQGIQSTGVLARVDHVATWSDSKMPLPQIGQSVFIVGYPKPEDLAQGDRISARFAAAGIAKSEDGSVQIRKYKFLEPYEGPVAY